MQLAKVQRKIGTLVLSLACVGLLALFVDRLLFQHFDLGMLSSDPALYFLVVSVVYFSYSGFHDSPVARLLLALGIFLFSGPLIYTNGSKNYFGLGSAIVGILLLHRFGFLARYFKTKVILILLWLSGWIYISDHADRSLSVAVSAATLLFITANLLMLYFLFEEEIRDLMAANKSKDAELAEQAAEIARLEPLSVLGERVAHVAHSFKNNLSLVGTALYYLEMNEAEKAAKKIKDFSKTMNERIDNILMVSRAGAEQAPELFDAARMLAGLNQVYLTEPAFLQRAKVELDANEPTPVFAARWDFLLMAENILKNALEALTTKGGYGNIRVSLKDRVFTLANDGGAMALCSDCRDDCLRCPRYGKPGQTTKVGGSGHGLAQVFATCRKYGWTLRIKTDGDWTSFEIGMPKSTGGLSAALPL